MKIFLTTAMILLVRLIGYNSNGITDRLKLKTDIPKPLEDVSPSAGSLKRLSRSDVDSRSGGQDGAGAPCIYEGHVETERNWFGYLANVSVRTTGQLSFEFAYPAHRCCQNVLFYLEDQVAVMSPRMNCWQKEYLLRPEDDQILRLTPSFSWSGCHVTTHDGVETFACKGGRSFSVDSTGDRLTTWYIAISNCASQLGIDLYYRLEIYGHVGDCVRLTSHESASRHLTGSGAGRSKSDNVGGNPTVSKASLMPREAGSTRQVTVSAPCIVQGNITSTYAWYGFVRNLSLMAGGGFRYHFTYPQDLQVQNIILYSEEDIVKLDWELSCYQKEEIIGQLQINEQIIEMHFRAAWNGCSASSDTDNNRTQYLTCQGERRYDSPRKIFMALSSCRSVQGVQLQYRLEVFGYAPDNRCSGQSRTYGRDSCPPLLLFVIMFWIVINRDMLSYCATAMPSLFTLRCRLISNYSLSSAGKTRFFLHFVFNLLESMIYFLTSSSLYSQLFKWGSRLLIRLASMLLFVRILNYPKIALFVRSTAFYFLWITDASRITSRLISGRIWSHLLLNLLNVETIINADNRFLVIRTNSYRVYYNGESPENMKRNSPQSTSNHVLVHCDVQSIMSRDISYRHDWTATGQGQFIMRIATLSCFSLPFYYYYLKSVDY